ncbi:hypothetical protein [Arcanobacterium phocae]|uniref:hypothetical protein n=1 Tax=Arcanobacterium phocae TaxID=131112 RepID=UPI001C0EFB1E|nr:hypothetical protein [Arcanobacterium phocae]
MGTKYNITSIILLTGLLLGTSPPAFAANNVEVGFTTTLAELKATVSDPATQSVTFTADNSFNGGLVIDHPMTFTINDGVDVTFDGSNVADKTGLDITSEFTLINNGNLIIEHFAGYGMKINQKVPGQEVTVRRSLLTTVVRRPCGEQLFTLNARLFSGTLSFIPRRYAIITCRLLRELR